jgi:uncharacterized protein YggE
MAMQRRILGWIVGATLLQGAIPAGVAAQEEEVRPQLTVRGEAVLEVPADQLRMDIGVVTDGPTAQAALDGNTTAMERVIAALTAAGLTAEEYRTGQFQIQPQRAPRPRDAGRDWRPRIVGYTVTNRLSVKTTRIDLAGKLIGAASGAGANTIHSIAFDLADPRSHRAAAIAAATANAIADAKALAEASDVRLVRILSLALDEAAAVPRPMPPIALREAVGMSMAAAEPPITPGDVTVRAGVSILYEIGPRK